MGHVRFWAIRYGLFKVIFSLFHLFFANIYATYEKVRFVMIRIQI